MVKKSRKSVDTSQVSRTEEGLVVREIPLEHILPDPYQPRKNFRKGPLRELAESIESQGLQQLPVVNPAFEKDGIQYYYLKAGERRYHAHHLLKRKTMMCIVEEKTYVAEYDPNRDLAQAAENSSREPHTHNEIVSLVERVVAAEVKQRGQLHGSVEIAHVKIAKAFGKSAAWVDQYHTLARLHSTLRELLDEEDDKKRLNFQIACALARAPQEEQLLLLGEAQRLRTHGGHAAMLQYITREGRAIRESRGERVRGRASDDKTALERTVLTLYRQSTLFCGSRKTKEHREYVQALLSKLHTTEVDALLRNLNHAMLTFGQLKELLDERRAQVYRPLSVVNQ